MLPSLFFPPPSLLFLFPFLLFSLFSLSLPSSLPFKISFLLGDARISVVQLVKGFIGAKAGLPSVGAKGCGK